MENKNTVSTEDLKRQLFMAHDTAMAEIAMAIASYSVIRNHNPLQ